MRYEIKQINTFKNLMILSLQWDSLEEHRIEFTALLNKPQYRCD